MELILSATYKLALRGKMKNYFFVTLLIMQFFSVAQAQEKSVTDLVDIGLSRAKDVEAANFDAKALEKFSEQAGAWQNPQLELGVGKRDQVGGTARQTTVGLSQPIGLSRFGLRGDVATLAARIGRAEADGASINLRTKLFSGLYAYLASDEKTHHAQERLRRFQEVQTFLKSRTFASPQKRAEANIVSGKIQVLQKEFLHLKSERDELWEDLNLYLGLAEKPIVKSPWFKKGPSYDFESLWSKVESKSPELKISRLNLEKTAKSAELARTERWPALTLSGFYTGETGFQPEKTYGVGIAFPIPIFNTGASTAQSADLQKRASQSRSAFEEQRLKKVLRTSLIHYQATQEAIRMVSIDSINSLENAMKVTDQGFRKSQVDLLTYIEADDQHSAGLSAIYDAQSEFASELSEILALTGESQFPVEK